MMTDSLFYASGNPSISVVRELMSLLPNAVAITDIETGELLAVTETAKTLFGLDGERWYQGMAFYKNASDWQNGLVELEKSGGGPLRMITTLFTAAGEAFTATCWVRNTQMAGRCVFITSIEPGEPQEVGTLPPPAFFTV